MDKAEYDEHKPLLYYLSKIISSHERFIRESNKTEKQKLQVFKEQRHSAYKIAYEHALNSNWISKQKLLKISIQEIIEFINS